MKCIALFSGGLDSILAIKLIEQQGIEVIPVTFKSYFFSEEKPLRFAGLYGLNLRVIDISDDHLEIVKNPVAGYGKNMNPCIDCHALMIKKAHGFMLETGASFLITGEVLDERPFSQSVEGMKKVDELTGLGDITLRPLSAKLLPPTIPERKGWVKRELLLDIKGRGRQRQIKLAEESGIKVYDTPAGGCILTDPQFSKRLKLFIQEITPREIQLLKTGRHFLIHGAHLIVARNQPESEFLNSLGEENILKPIDKKGPTGLLRKWETDTQIEIASRIVARYSKPFGPAEVKFGNRILTVEPLSPEETENYLIK